MKTLNKSFMKIALTTFFCLTLATISSAATKQQVVMMDAAGNIKYVSQAITKAYFYNSLQIRVVQAKKEILEGATTLDESIKTLSAGLTDEEEKGVLTFIEFARDEMKTTLKQPYSDDNGAMMLDFSESLLEGAQMIGSKHIQEGDVEQAALVNVKRMIFLLERVNKYYIAHKAGFKDYNNVVQLENSVKAFEDYQKKVNTYNYPAAMRSETEKINKFWPIAKQFYLGIEKGALPVIVMSSTNNLARSLKKLRDYHLKTIGTK